MIGAGTFISPLLKLIVTVGTLAAVYFFIINPALDTTEKAIERTSGIGDSISQSVQESIDNANDAFDEALEDSGAGTAEIEGAGEISNEADVDRLLACIQRAQQDIERIVRCQEKFG